uniref:Uncharacterized protein n=1 Tax=viral metagenome TaxID=1070528 RepID=A0A6M3J650_9ZZZZ
MHYIHGHFEGTGAALYLQLGAVPDEIEIWNLDGATPDTFIWNKMMGSNILTVEGITRIGSGGAVTDEVFGAGISPYYGGDLLTTSNQSNTTYGGGVYIERDDKDYRYFTDSAAGISGDAATTTIDTWTLDTAATPKGHFNGDVTGTYIGPGSLIRVVDTKGKGSGKHTYEAFIVALTAGQGVSSDEVTLSWAIPSGRVDFIGGMYGYKPSTVGTVTKAGIKLNMTTPLNVDGEHHAFRAIWQ